MRYLIVHTDRPAVLQLFDEIGNAMPVPGLIQKLNILRSRQLPTWLYWQSIEQMQKYGIKADEGANIILGEVDRAVDSTYISWGDDLLPTRTQRPSLEREPKFFPHELMELDDAEARVELPESQLSDSSN